MKRSHSVVAATLALLLGILANAAATDWFVAPDGKADNSGAQAEPWNIASALNGEHEIRPGDTIYIRGGEYRQPWEPGEPGYGFEVRLRGAEGNPILIRPYADERVTLSGLLVVAPSDYLWIRDFEIAGTVPEEERTSPSPGTQLEDLPGPQGGFEARSGRQCKYINLVIHDNIGSGVGFWRPAIDSELYGCIIYDNGWRGPDRNHGHCIYTQNQEGVKTISNCIMSTPYGGGQQTVQAYGSSRAYVDNYLFEHNVAYERGRFLIGGGRPSRNIRVIENYLYNLPLQLGYNAPENEDCIVRGNVVYKGGLIINKFNQVTREDNLVAPGPNEAPDEPLVKWLPNKYDENRAHLVIYNWNRADEVTIPAAPFLSKGDSYSALDPKDFYGEPVFEGECQGETITAPVEGEFAVFVVMKHGDK